jgi:hypothetical protein
MLCHRMQPGQGVRKQCYMTRGACDALFECQLHGQQVDLLFWCGADRTCISTCFLDLALRRSQRQPSMRSTAAIGRACQEAEANQSHDQRPLGRAQEKYKACNWQAHMLGN